MTRATCGSLPSPRASDTCSPSPSTDRLPSRGCECGTTTPPVRTHSAALGTRRTTPSRRRASLRCAPPPPPPPLSSLPHHSPPSRPPLSHYEVKLDGVLIGSGELSCATGSMDGAQAHATTICFSDDPQVLSALEASDGVARASEARQQQVEACTHPIPVHPSQALTCPCTPLHGACTPLRARARPCRWRRSYTRYCAARRRGRARQVHPWS